VIARVHDAEELVPLPATGRVFEQTVVVGLGDAAPGHRVRLDALAHWLQDVAHADLLDAGLADRALWVVRRTRMRVERFPRFDEPATLQTFVSGLGRAWAERRTIVTTPGGGRVDAVTLWVHLDPSDARPAPLGADELALYGPSAQGREIRARLRHPAAPPADSTATPWHFRAAELDVADHINNAASWTVVEEELLAGEPPAALDVELEYRTPTQPGRHAVLRAGPRRWIVGDDGEVRTSVLLTGADPRRTPA
jgi:acyl-ACP thioesterase